MRNNNQGYDAIQKFREFRALFDKIFIISTGIIWIISTLWDIYQLQRYWLDYMVEFYSCFFVFCMMIIAINPRLLPVKIYNSFSFISTIRGRATLYLIISSLFLTDKHDFHKLCAIFFFLGGILYFIGEILVPTTKKELEEIESIFNKKPTVEVKIDNSNNSTNVETNKSSVLDNSTSVMNNNNAIIEKITENNQETKAANTQNNILVEESLDNPKKNEEENKISNILVEEEIVKKTDNPYEIPEDF